MSTARRAAVSLMFFFTMLYIHGARGLPERFPTAYIILKKSGFVKRRANENPPPRGKGKYSGFQRSVSLDDICAVEVHGVAELAFLADYPYAEFADFVDLFGGFLVHRRGSVP